MGLKIIMLELIIVYSRDVFEYFVGSEESAYLHDNNIKVCKREYSIKEEKHKQPRTQNPFNNELRFV